MLKQRALIDIDMILDTRFGTLVSLDIEASKVLVTSEWYQLRSIDRFEEVTNGAIKDKDYIELYNQHKVETLKESVFTNFIFVLRDEIEDFIPRMYSYGDTVEIIYYINTYPYKLLEEEKEIMRRAIARYLPPPAKVEMVDLAYHLLTPGMLNNNYDMMAIYNYEDWLRHHMDNLNENPIREFSIFYPRIAQSGVVPEPTRDFKDPFMIVPMITIAHIQMTPIPTAMTCWNPYIYLYQATTSEDDTDTEEDLEDSQYTNFNYPPPSQ